MTIGFWAQCRLLLRKNALEQIRNPGKLISQFVIAFCIILLIFIFDVTLVEQPAFTKEQNIKEIDLPECPEFLGDDCVDLYIHNNNLNHMIIKNDDVIELYNYFKKTYPKKNIILINSTNMGGRSIEDFLYDEDLHYVTTLLIHPDVTFKHDGVGTQEAFYSVLVNPHVAEKVIKDTYMKVAWETQQFLLTKMNDNKEVTIDFKFNRFPNNRDGTLKAQLLDDICGPYLFLIFFVNFIIFLNLIVKEKENGQRLYMKMIGMYDSAY